MKAEEVLLKTLKKYALCDNCLGRSFGRLVFGLSNKERGFILRNWVAFLIDTGEKIEINPLNFYGIKFRNIKITARRPPRCFVCQNFFDEKIENVVEAILKKLKRVEFESFLVGSKIPNQMLIAEEKVLKTANLEWAEPIKSEINREIGKLIEKLTGKRFEAENPDITILVDLKNNEISLQVKGLYVFGKYKKLVRGIPQTTRKPYPTSIQEEIERPLLKASGSKKSAFHGLGREDIDVRCLGWRPFIIELVKPIKRKIKLRKVQKEINKSKKVKVSGLKIIEDGIEVGNLKSKKVDKSYLAEVIFKKPIQRKKLKWLKKLIAEPIFQKTPLRVVHRRADKWRKRRVKRISWKLLGKKKLQLKITGEAGLYIKELISGDEGRTKPNVAEILENEVEKIILDVVKISGC